MNALGNLVRSPLLPGQAHDMKGVGPLIKGVSFDALLAEKAFDVDWLLQDLDEHGATAVILPKTTVNSSAIMMRRVISGAIWWRMTSQRSKSSEG